MTDPIVLLEGEWRRGSSGATLAGRLRVWAECEPALTPFPTPELLFRFLRTEPSARRDAVFCALLARAREEPLAGQVLLEALLPGLKALARQLLREPSQRDELWELLLFACWERICCYPLERRPSRVAANLLQDTRRAALRALGRDPNQPFPASANQHTATQQPERDVVEVLLRAVKAGSISRREAQLIVHTRIDGVDLRLLAHRQGVAYNTLVVRRLRAERRLLLFLGQPPVTSRQRRRHISPARAVRRARG